MSGKRMRKRRKREYDTKSNRGDDEDGYIHGERRAVRRVVECRQCFVVCVLDCAVWSLPFDDRCLLFLLQVLLFTDSRAPSLTSAHLSLLHTLCQSHSTVIHSLLYGSQTFLSSIREIGIYAELGHAAQRGDVTYLPLPMETSTFHSLLDNFVQKHCTTTRCDPIL